MLLCLLFLVCFWSPFWSPFCSPFCSIGLLRPYYFIHCALQILMFILFFLKNVLDIHSSLHFQIHFNFFDGYGPASHYHLNLQFHDCHSLFMCFLTIWKLLLLTAGVQNCLTFFYWVVCFLIHRSSLYILNTRFLLVICVAKNFSHSLL